MPMRSKKSLRLVSLNPVANSLKGAEDHARRESRTRDALVWIKIVRTEERAAVVEGPVWDAMPGKHNVQTADAVVDIATLRPEGILLHHFAQGTLDARFRDLLVVQFGDDAKSKRRKRLGDQFAVAHRAPEIGQALVLVLVAREDEQNR